VELWRGTIEDRNVVDTVVKWIFRIRRRALLLKEFYDVPFAVGANFPVFITLPAEFTVRHIWYLRHD
jgi:hypothetical protein